MSFTPLEKCINMILEMTDEEFNLRLDEALQNRIDKENNKSEIEIVLPRFQFGKMLK